MPNQNPESWEEILKSKWNDWDMNKKLMFIRYEIIPEAKQEERERVLRELKVLAKEKSDILKKEGYRSETPILFMYEEIVKLLSPENRGNEKGRP